MARESACSQARFGGGSSIQFGWTRSAGRRLGAGSGCQAIGSSVGVGITSKLAFVTRVIRAACIAPDLREEDE